MVDNIFEPVDYKALTERYIVRDGFVFWSITYPHNIFDAILIRNPQNTKCFSPRLPYSERSVEEHISLINELKLEKAIIIAENIDFIVKCPSLKYIKIIPVDSVGDGFDYSPLYNMPQIKCLQCSTQYGFYEQYSTSIDCSKINGLEDIHVTNTKYQSFNEIVTLKGLGLSNYKKNDLSEAFNSVMLDTLSIFQSKLISLDGIQKSQKMQCLYLYYNRSLRDISALKNIKNTLKALRIENCPKIEDFSVLCELENLELLELSGSNTLPDLFFLKQMKNLKTFVFDINILDGDLSSCLDLSYVFSKKNRKHYNLKDSELPKGRYVRGNETIEEWRRLE